jgi:1-acyl-sn-glycerol-3-phosphate acyltransferase
MSLAARAPELPEYDASPPEDLSPTDAAEEVKRLRQIEAVCLRDMAILAGLDRLPGAQRMLDVTFGWGVRRFARDLNHFDRQIGSSGVAEASRWLAGRYGGEIKVAGPGRVPVDGPALLVANHPGLMDTLAIYATVDRPDIRALARPQALLLLMPEMDRHLLFMPDTGPNRAGALRAMLRHLREGGSAIIFPAGHLEPEPTLLDGRKDPLGEWSTGVGALMRLAVKHRISLQIIPTAISGVLAEGIRHRFSPLIRLRRTAQGRADLTALIQLVFPRLVSTTVTVSYGEPLDAAALIAQEQTPEDMTGRVKAAVYDLLGDAARDGG